MQDVKKQEVDGVEYEFYFLSPLKALPLGTRIAKMVVGPLGGAFNVGNVSKLMDSEINLGNALKDLAALDEKEFTSLIRELLGTVRLGTGMEINIDIHFQGKLKHMMNVAIKAMEYNFNDFFVDLRDGLGKFIRRVSPSDMTQDKQQSSGSSGGSSSQGSQRSKK